MFHSRTQSRGFIQKTRALEVKESVYGLWRTELKVPPLSGTLWRRGGKTKESLQLCLWNLNSTFKSPVAPRRLSCQISANQREAETSANVTKHWKTRAKGNDVITNVISANQHSGIDFFDIDIQIPET